MPIFKLWNMNSMQDLYLPKSLTEIKMGITDIPV